jgi:HSP20 family protein
MAITKFDPFREVESMGDRLTRFFEGSLLNPFGAGRRGEEGITWMPPVDIYEDDNEYIIKAELPDMEEKDVELKIEDNILTIQGKKKLEHEVKKEGYRLVESSCGAFSRSFSLPSNVDGEKASAKFEKGVLKVSLPKRPEAKAKHITIKLN